jgi:hypothetical protein
MTLAYGKRGNTISRVAVAALIFASMAFAQRLSRSFELRYFSPDPKANGETDFKGPSEVFTTEDRIQYLQAYARYARKFFDDPNWNKLVVPDAEVAQVLRAIKPQPLPTVRQRIRLDEWKWLGSRPGQREERLRQLAEWRRKPGVEVVGGELRFTGSQPALNWTLEPQSWRMFLQWRARMPVANQRAAFSLSGVVEAGFAADGTLFYSTQAGAASVGAYKPGQWVEFKVEIDLESKRYNLYIDGELRADFVPVLEQRPIEAFRITGVKGLRIDDVWGVGYVKENNILSRDVPFSIKTFVDENFEAKPPIEGWNLADYDDSRWKSAELPFAHGGERYAGEYLYLRKSVRVPAFARAVLNVETIDPGGEIWINGEVVLARRNRHPASLDVTEFLKPGQENLIAIRVVPNFAKRTMRHTAADRHTGWFAGRAWLDLTGLRYIEDAFVYAKTASDPATVHVQVDVRNEDWELEEREVKKLHLFKGEAVVEFYPWFPQESEQPAAVAAFPIEVRLKQSLRIEGEVALPHPLLWTPEKPQLYKVVVRLLGEDRKPVDDIALTTGLRTISQEGGTFRINGKPAMMNGPLLMPFRAPLDKIATWTRCSPAEWLIKDILMIKRQNGNSARMSHHDGPDGGGINDPRYAEYADQLGLMFQWATSSWIRSASPWGLDFEGLPLYVRQVRNHPSIVMWQPANHPAFRSFEEGIPWLERLYSQVYTNDPSRLISPTANLTRLLTRNDAGTVDASGKAVAPVAVWTAPMITRGSMDHAIGYGSDWSSLRAWPNAKDFNVEDNWRSPAHRTDMLNSKHRAYFDFENEETIGQPNWNLHKGKPEYRIMSYEFRHNAGSIGRFLTTDEWEESQAWQAFSGYEAYRKKRWLDYDGLAWCSLGGGPNTVTYQKPLTDYWGEAKIAFYAVKMAFQPVLAGSKNVDMVYGPGDAIPVVAMNIGDSRQVDVVVTITDMDGTQVAEKRYSAMLPAGRTATDLPAFKPEVPRPGYFAVEYEIVDRTK